MADAQIILTDSRHNRIVALASGEKYPGHTPLCKSADSSATKPASTTCRPTSQPLPVPRWPI